MPDEEAEEFDTIAQTMPKKTPQRAAGSGQGDKRDANARGKNDNTPSRQTLERIDAQHNIVHSQNIRMDPRNKPPTVKDRKSWTPEQGRPVQLPMERSKTYTHDEDW